MATDGSLDYRAGDTSKRLLELRESLIAPYKSYHCQYASSSMKNAVYVWLPPPWIFNTSRPFTVNTWLRRTLKLKMRETCSFKYSFASFPGWMFLIQGGECHFLRLMQKSYPMCNYIKYRIPLLIFCGSLVQKLHC